MQEKEFEARAARHERKENRIGMRVGTWQKAIQNCVIKNVCNAINMCILRTRFVECINDNLITYCTQT